MADKIALLGSGFIGRSWAIAFSRAGYEIGLHDPTPGAVDAALAFIDEMLEDLAKNDLLNGHSPAAVRGPSSTSTSAARRGSDTISIRACFQPAATSSFPISARPASLRRRSTRCGKRRSIPSEG